MVDEVWWMAVIVARGKKDERMPRWLFLSLSNNRYTVVEVHSNRVRLAVENLNMFLPGLVALKFVILLFQAHNLLNLMRCLAVALRQR